MLNCPGSDCWKILFPKNFKEDAKSILKFSWPILFSSVSEMLVPIVPLIFVGQLGETELAAAGLGISYCNLVGFAQLFGLDTATQTLSAQSFGAGNLFRYGVISQRAVILQLTWALIILPLWINSEKILLKLGQEKDVARIAGLFINTRIPSLLLQGIYRTMKTYLYCQEVSAPLVVIGFICLGFSVVANYLFVSYLKMGVVGSAIAIDLTYLLLCLLLFGYIRKKKISQTWPGWSGECLLQWGQFVKLALPGALMIFFDWGSAETGVFLMGLVGKVEVGAQSVIFNIINILFMVSASLNIAASVKVGSYLGSGEPQKAINSAKIAFILFLILSVFDALLLISLKDYIGYAFSKSKNVIKMISSVCPIIAAYHILDGSQGIASGILRGIGLQRFGAVINFIGFMVVGLPLGAVLALVVHLNVVGFWCGMAVGIALQVILALILLVCSNWKDFSRKARKHAEVPGLEFSDESTSKEEYQKVRCQKIRLINFRWNKFWSCFSNFAVNLAETLKNFCAKKNVNEKRSKALSALIKRNMMLNLFPRIH
ncbi:multidrug and toxin extrusion protein 1-like isoform X2 [Rhopilema esculentum]|uniref:multidrug and toxin extrusion protein 1-like isoform X2 n=1 Tax=Rhopilema esculentum TaxID=499914 RepID=UPI0031D34E5A